MSYCCDVSAQGGVCTCEPITQDPSKPKRIRHMNPMDQATMYNFTRGDRVRYIPHHANGIPYHRDCEDGLVVRIGKHEGTVFVVYDGPAKGGQVLSLEFADQWTAQGTPPEALVKLGDDPN